MDEIRTLKAHWAMLIDRSGYRKNLDGLSEEIGKSSSYLRGLLRNSAVPGVDVCIRLSKALGCPVEELLLANKMPLIDPVELGEAISREVSKVMSDRLWGQGAQPTGEDVMNWWVRNGGRLESTEFIDECFDLFTPPDTATRQINPHAIGKRSLASISLGCNSKELFNRTVQPLDEKYRHMILLAHSTSLEKGPITTIECLDTLHPETGDRIKIEYARTLAPVVAEGGQQLILNYSKLIRKS